MDNCWVALVIALVIVIILIVTMSGSQKARGSGSEGLCMRDCAHRAAALRAYDIGMEESPVQSLPPCEDRYRGISPFLPPNRPCYAATYNPFWAPFGDGGVVTGTEQFYDVPISRMVGDHVPLE
jgi:hypothetical protein